MQAFLKSKFPKLFNLVKKIQAFFVHLNKLLFPNHYYKKRIKKYEAEISRCPDPVIATKRKYYNQFGTELDLDNPTKFYEKLNFLKLFYEEKDVTKLVDKILVKEYLTKNGYGNIFPKKIDEFDTVEELKDFVNKKTTKLDSYVVKLNHTSGDVFLCIKGKWKNKMGERINKRVVFAAAKQMLNFNYYYVNFQSVYKNIKPRILVEEFLPSLKSQGLEEFKLFCNYGEPKFYRIVCERQSGHDLKDIFLDSDLNILPVTQGHTSLDIENVKIPRILDKIVEFCRKTVKDRPLVRVDVMLNEDKFIFSEFTFFDYGGMNIYHPFEYNEIFGGLFDIDNIVKDFKTK